MPSDLVVERNTTVASLPHHPTHLAPRHRNGAKRQGLGSGALGQVVVGLVGPMGPVLEPLPFHPQTRGEGMQLLVAVRHQVGPPVLHRAEPRRLSPVVEVDGHGCERTVGLR
jgi:hypothetical protein